MQYVYDYHNTLDELGQASNELLKKPHGAFFNTQIRKTLMQKYLFLVASHSLKIHGEDYAVTLRKELTCSMCARFFSRMGAVVYMTREGAQSVYWNPDAVSDPVMKLVVADMKRLVEGSRIMALFNPNGSYAHYTEMTNNGEKPFRHYFVDVNALAPRHPLTSAVMKMPDASTFNSRVEALVRFVLTTPYSAVTIMEQWLESGTIKHVGDSKNTIVMLKDLLAGISIIKATPAYDMLDNPYSQETVLINMIWRKALEDQNLLTLKNSLLGVTITKIVDLEKTGRTEQGIKAIIESWKIQSDGLHHRRPTAPASNNEVARALEFLEVNGYMDSLEQVETSEDMLPVMWETKGKYSPIDEAAPVTGGFAQFASAKKADEVTPKGPYKVAGVTDMGYFFNEVLPHVENMAMLIPAATRWCPTFFNTMANPDAKAIFTWDTEENRCPHLMFRYEQPFTMTQMVTPVAQKQPDLYAIDVLSVTSAYTIGINPTQKETGLVLMLGGMRSPFAPRATLFATSVKNELYEYRKALEEYSSKSSLARTEKDQAVGFPIGPIDPRRSLADRIPTVAIQVKFTPEFAAIMGHKRAVYMIDITGYHVTPDVDKYPCIVNRYATVEAEPVVELPPEDPVTPVAQPITQ